MDSFPSFTHWGNTPLWVSVSPILLLIKDRRNTMDKTAIKTLIAWLASASDDDIQDKLDEINLAEKKVKSKEGLSDLALARRLIDEEIISRLDFLNLKQD